MSHFDATWKHVFRRAFLRYENTSFINNGLSFKRTFFKTRCQSVVVLLSLRRNSICSWSIFKFIHLVCSLASYKWCFHTNRPRLNRYWLFSGWIQLSESKWFNQLCIKVLFCVFPYMALLDGGTWKKSSYSVWVLFDYFTWSTSQDAELPRWYHHLEWHRLSFCLFVAAWDLCRIMKCEIKKHLFTA